MKKTSFLMMVVGLCSGVFTVLSAQDSAQTQFKPGMTDSFKPKDTVILSKHDTSGTKPGVLPSSNNVVSKKAALKAAGHFPNHTITGNNMIVAILAAINPTIDGRPLEKGDEIAAFTPDGQCAGVTKWKGGGKNVALCVWGKNLQTSFIDGMKVGDSIHYRIWDSVHQIEVIATPTYNTTGIKTSNGTIAHPTSGGIYVIDGISMLASLTGFSAPPAPIRLLSPKDSGFVAADSVAFVWTRGPSGIDRYIIEAAGDSSLSSVIFEDTLVDTVAYCGKSLQRGATYWWRVKGQHGGVGWNECTAPGRFRIAP